MSKSRESPNYDIRRATEWRNLNVEPDPFDIETQVETKIIGSFRTFLSEAYHNPDSPQGLVTDALIDMGEKIDEEPENGTGVMGGSGVLYFFREGDLVAKKSDFRAGYFREKDRKNSVFGRFYDFYDNEGNNLSKMLSAFEQVDEIGVHEESSKKSDTLYSIDMTGEDLYQVAKELGIP